MKIKYTNNVAWLRDYVESVSDLVPLKKIKKIVGYKVKIGWKEHQEAQIRIGKDDKFTISIKLYDNDNITHVPIEISRVLDSLAHELSHAGNADFEHSPEHFRLQAKIMYRWYKVLKKNKVEDTWKKWIK